jgi:hypothetical protein
MTTTGANLLIGYSKFLGDFWSGTTTGAGLAGGTTVVDTALGRFGDDRLIGWYIRLTGATNQWEVRRITDFVASTGTVTVQPAFTAQTATTETYDLHKYDPSVKFETLDEARMDVSDDVFRVIYDEQLTGDGRASTFAIPSTITSGPLVVLVEDPLEAETSWNFLTNPKLDSTDNWTDSANVTASTYDLTDEDLMIPKYAQTCTKLVATAASTYGQVIGDMTNNITAARAAGRTMTFGMWVYDNVGTTTLDIVTDGGTLASSSTHSGNGWQLLTVTGDVETANATTLTAQLSIAAAATLYVDRAWFYFGDDKRITERYSINSAIHITRRDNATQTFTLQSAPERGRQLRVVGKTQLTALGTTASTQVTNTMEVSEVEAEILYARAAEILFIRQGLSTESQAPIAGRIGLVRERLPNLRKNWALEMPPHMFIGPYSA